MRLWRNNKLMNAEEKAIELAKQGCVVEAYGGS